MMRHIPLLVTVGLALALAGVPVDTLAEVVAGAQGDEPMVSNPCTDIEPGAAAMEPPQSLQDPEEIEESAAHATWLGEVWTSP